MYMWLNNTEGVDYTQQAINWATGNANELGLNFTTDEWVFTNPNAYSMQFRISLAPEAGFEDVPYKIIATNNGRAFMSIDATGDYETAYNDAPDIPFNVNFYISSAASFQYQAGLTIIARFQGSITPVIKSALSSISTINEEVLISNAIPKLKVIDFLKGLFNMFKLVAIPDDLGNVYINTIDAYYQEGNIYDITKWIDFESYDVERGKIFNNINFKYQDPTTILNMQFKKNTGEAYGDESLVLADEEGEPLDGDSLEIELPFEQVVYERLTDQNTNTLTNVQYGLITDESIEPANPKAVLFYNNIVTLEGSPISIINESGDTVEIDGTVNTPSHTLGFDNPAFSLLWGVEFSTWNAIAIINTLYSKFWQSYITSIFNIKRRNFKFKAKLPTYLLTKLKLNDVLYIKERYYRINDFTVNLTNRDATLNLMNTFENNFGLFVPSQYKVYLSKPPQEYGVYVSNGSVMNFSKIDTGYGTSWATITKSGFNIIINVTENNTFAPRDLYISVNNGAGKSFEILLSQSEL